MALFTRKVSPPDAQVEKTKPGEGRRPVCLALQGGGALGAFQWGVLDRLLEDDRLDIRAISAASAGAMNGAALISGLGQDGSDGGIQGARLALDRLWRETNRSGGQNVFGDSAMWSAALTPEWIKDTAIWRSMETLAGSMSPYEFNPFNLNPLKRVLDGSIDFDVVRNSGVQIGRAHV